MASFNPIRRSRHFAILDVGSSVFTFFSDIFTRRREYKGLTLISHRVHRALRVFLMRILEKEDSHQSLTCCVFDIDLGSSAYLSIVQIDMPKAECFA